MKILFLRGSVPPPHEHPEKLLYNNIDECEDMWTQLWYQLCLDLDAEGELWYDKSNEPNFIKIDKKRYERWASSFKLLNYEPDIIFARGGFDSYKPVLKRYKDVFKIYYGAGRRFIPQGKINYNLILADSPIQLEKLQSKGYSNSSLFIKPASKLFKYIPKIDKEYDILFVGNGSHAHLKGHKFMLETFVNTNYRILNIGNINQKMIELGRKLNVNITWGGWHLRKKLPELMNKCKTALVCTTEIDSCPRVIPEALACGLPLIITDTVHFWKEKYITKDTGIICKKQKDSILSKIDHIINNYDNKKIRTYYENHLNLQKASKYIIKLIQDTKKCKILNTFFNKIATN